MLINVISKGLWTSSLFFQQFTYAKARQVLLEDNLTSVLDVGCGYLAKMAAIIYPFTKDITGIDQEDVINRLVNVPFGKWISADLNKQNVDLGRKFDLIICADCIEHVLLFQTLLDTIKKHCDTNTKIVLSTPDSDTILRQRYEHKHIWNKKDFEFAIENSGFEIIESKSVVELDSSNPKYNSTIVVCKVNDIPKVGMS